MVYLFLYFIICKSTENIVNHLCLKESCSKSRKRLLAIIAINLFGKLQKNTLILDTKNTIYKIVKT